MWGGYEFSRSSIEDDEHVYCVEPVAERGPEGWEFFAVWEEWDFALVHVLFYLHGASRGMGPH